MFGESSCTLYKYNSIGFNRFFIPSCHWQENRAANVLKSGLQTADSVTVYISKNAILLTPNKGIFPISAIFPKMEISPKNVAKDMLVKGLCEFEFNNESPKTVSESMKEFRNLFPEFVTVSSVDRKLYGLDILQHIKVSAK